MSEAPPPKRRDRAPEYLEVAAAYLAHLGHNQIRIAELLTGHGWRVSQPKVSRLLTRAKEVHGLLVDRSPEFNRARVPEELLRRLASEFETDAELGDRLRRESPVFAGAHVVEAREVDFIRGAAVMLPNLLRGAEVLGISWGSTCRRLIDALVSGDGLAKLEACIPIQGDPAFWNNGKAASFSATRLAQLLEEALLPERRKEEYQYSLIGVPAYVSPGLQKGVETFYGTMPGYRKVFGEGGAAGRLNGLITSVGVPSHEDPARRGVFILERLAQKDTTQEELDRICFGDFSGILLPKEASGTDSAKVAELNAGWTGLKESRLREIAALDPEVHPGTIVVAEGAYKARAILAAVRSHFITRLIIGTELRDTLHHLLAGEAGPGGADACVPGESPASSAG